MIAITDDVTRPQSSSQSAARTARFGSTTSETGSRHASAHAWDALRSEMDRQFRNEGRADGDVRDAARRIAADMLTAGASMGDVRDALRRSIRRHALEVALEGARDARGLVAGGEPGDAFLADVLQCVMRRESMPAPRRQ